MRFFVFLIPSTSLEWMTSVWIHREKWAVSQWITFLRCFCSWWSVAKPELDQLVSRWSLDPQWWVKVCNMHLHVIPGWFNTSKFHLVVHSSPECKCDCSLVIRPVLLADWCILSSFRLRFKWQINYRWMDMKVSWTHTWLAAVSTKPVLCLLITVLSSMADCVLWWMLHSFKLFHRIFPSFWLRSQFLY